MSNVRLIGGEMADWADESPASGTLSAHLLRQLVPSGGRVLLAGPHAKSFVDAAAEFASVTCLVRSLPDALALERPGVTVLCGTLAKLTDTGPYDVVVALDGVDRLCSSEGPQYDWAESVRALCRALRPGGALLLMVENELGVHRLVDRGPAPSPSWSPLGEFGSKPGTPARLTDRLTADGLTVGWLAAAWAGPTAPSLAVAVDVLRDGPSGALSAAVTHAVAAAYAEQPVLADPRRLAAAAVRAGLGPELAPAWLVLAFRGAAAPIHLPDLLTADGPATGLPAGRLVEELLITACLQHDLPELRRVLGLWAHQQPGASFTDVLVDGDTLHVIAPSRPTREPAAVLQGFARTVLTGGYHQPWRAADDVPTLTSILLAVAGLDPGTPAPDPGPPPPLSLREHEVQLRRLEERLSDAADRIRHTEIELAKREAELRRARLQIDTFSGTVGFRLSRLGARAARRAVRMVRPESS